MNSSTWFLEQVLLSLDLSFDVNLCGGERNDYLRINIAFQQLSVEYFGVDFC